MQLLRRNKAVKVAIFGAYKSGTTGLFYKIRNSLPAGARLLFEPAAYVPEPGEGYVVAKVMIGCPPPSAYETFLGFDRKIYLVRDPRDWLISGLLFVAQQESAIYNDAGKLAHLISLFRQKENDPRSLTVCELLEAQFMASRGESLADARAWLVRQYDWLLAFDTKIGEHLRVKYEDFVDDRLAALATYLGTRLHGKAIVDEPHDHVPRSMRHGDWRNWFTERDVEFFRPLFSSYMRHFGYAEDWRLAAHPVILPEHSTGYIERTVRKRKGQSGDFMHPNDKSR
jgi:hypothetical protein